MRDPEEIEPIVVAAVRIATFDAVGLAEAWLLKQPDGWARDGAERRLAKVQETLAIGVLKKAVAQGLREHNQYPPPIRDDPEACDAYDFLVGRWPTEVCRESVAWSTDMTGGDLVVRFEAVFVAPARRLMGGIGIERLQVDGRDVTIIDTDWQMSTLPREEKTYSVIVRVSKRDLADFVSSPW